MRTKPSRRNLPKRTLSFNKLKYLIKNHKQELESERKKIKETKEP